MMISLRTSSAAETAAVGLALAEVVGAGDLILLCGDLGAGKTNLVKGFGRGLGVTDAITSPTFTLVREYQGRLRLYHLDVYRFERIDEVADLGLAEMLDDDSVTVIEWGDTIARALHQDFLEVHLHLGDDDAERLIQLVPVGSRWSARSRLLGDTLAPWRTTEDG